MSNLKAAEALVREAFRKDAKWVILPEFFPSAVAFVPNMLTAWRPLEGEPFQLMQKLAREYEGVVGGSFIARSGDDCFNSFLLVFPSGEYFRHDKDIPTMWENCYYIGGQDEGVLKTPAGPVGVAICWEFIRSSFANDVLYQWVRAITNQLALNASRPPASNQFGRRRAQSTRNRHHETRT